MEKKNASVCYQLDVVGPKSYASLQKRCKVWWLSELYEQTIYEARNEELQKMYIEWSATHSVSFLRANYLKMMGKTAAELLSESRVLKFGRKKRQIGVVAAGVSVLGGYILGSQWEYVKRQLGIGDGTVPEGVVDAINDDDQHFNILGRQLVSLEKASYELRLSLIHI